MSASVHSARTSPRNEVLLIHRISWNFSNESALTLARNWKYLILTGSLPTHLDASMVVGLLCMEQLPKNPTGGPSTSQRRSHTGLRTRFRVPDCPMECVLSSSCVSYRG